MKLYAFYWDCGRMGDLGGLFVADDSAVEGIIGKHVYFGEVLGKHSEIEGTLQEEDFIELSEDQDLIRKLITAFESNLQLAFDGCTFNGYNPFSYLEEVEEDEDA